MKLIGTTFALLCAILLAQAGQAETQKGGVTISRIKRPEVLALPANAQPALVSGQAQVPDSPQSSGVDTGEFNAGQPPSGQLQPGHFDVGHFQLRGNSAAKTGEANLFDFNKIWKSEPLKSGSGATTNATTETTTTIASPAKIQDLAAYDVVILIDSSGSMDIPDCPGDISRWKWCQDQTTKLARDLSPFKPGGITMVVFASSFRVYNDVTLEKVGAIFKENSPYGGTRTYQAMKSQIDAFMGRRVAWVPKKPLLMVVITDGAPEEPESVRRLIIDTTHHLSKPSDARITFLQIGWDLLGGPLLRELDTKLVAEGARADIVNLMDFSQVQQLGIERALLDTISTSR
jgi:hypothetical protein